MVKFSDYFNSTTIRGRANVAKATYASIAVLYVFNRFKKSKKNADPHSKDGEHDHGPPTDSPEAKGHYECPCCNECNTESKSHEEGAALGGDGHGHLIPLEPNGNSDSSSKTNNGQAEASPKSNNNHGDHNNGAAKSNCDQHEGH